MTALFQHDGMLSNNQEYFFAQSVQGMESKCIIWFLLMGTRRGIISQELSRKQMEDTQIRREKTALFAPPVCAPCSLSCRAGS